MSDIPPFEPNWSLDDPNIIGQNADAFKTIEETIAKIKLIKEVGLANLHEKGVLIKEPYCSVYDMVSAIKNIPVSSGWARQIPKFNSEVKINRLKTLKEVWITSFPTILATYANVRINELSSIREVQANPYFVDWGNIKSGEKKEISIQSITGDNLYCFIWYSVPLTSEDSFIPFSMPPDWILQKKSESLQINNMNYRLALYIKDMKASGEQESVVIINTGSNRINCCLIDFWGYKTALEFVGEYSGVKLQSIKKDFNESCLWVIRSADVDTQNYIIREDSIKKNCIFDDIIRQNAIFLDRDPSGKREISFSGEKPFSVLLFRMS